MTRNPISTDMPDLPEARATLALTQYTLAALAEVLSMVEEFLRTAGPNVHAELRGYLRAQWPPADPAWLIDMVGFHGLHLHHQLHQPSPTAVCSPRDNWQPANHIDDQESTEEVAW